MDNPKSTSEWKQTIRFKSRALNQSINATPSFYTDAAHDGGYAKRYYLRAIEAVAPRNAVPGDPTSWNEDEFWNVTKKARYAIVRVKLVSAYRDGVWVRRVARGCHLRIANALGSGRYLSHPPL